MQRVIEREWLDELPPENAGAAGSRRDLQRLNAWMGNAGLVAQQLRGLPQKPTVLTEMGAGDGRFMLQVARRLSRDWAGTRLRLVDKQRVSLESVEREFASLGWRVESIQADVFELLNNDVWDWGEATVANLFLHHFSRAKLADLFSRLAERTNALIGVEPRRSGFALTASRLVGLIGCNHVTRHDAPASVRAGFSGRELSELWPANGQWTLQEGRAGLFSHLFVAERVGTNPKSEIRNPKEARNPKPETSQRVPSRDCKCEGSKTTGPFGFRPSDFGFLADMTPYIRCR
jgi:hypothetical protein